MLDPRGQLLRAALGFSTLPLPSYDSWAGIGRVAVGMHRQGYDLQLTQYDERGWRATFYVTGMEHSPTSATGTGWERTVARDAAGGVGGAETYRINDASVRAAGPETEAAEGIEAVMATKYLKATLVIVLILVLLPITIGLMNFATPRQRAWIVWGFVAVTGGFLWVRALVSLFRDERL